MRAWVCLRAGTITTEAPVTNNTAVPGAIRHTAQPTQVQPAVRECTHNCVPIRGDRLPARVQGQGLRFVSMLRCRSTRWWDGPPPPASLRAGARAAAIRDGPSASVMPRPGGEVALTPICMSLCVSGVDACGFTKHGLWVTMGWVPNPNPASPVLGFGVSSEAGGQAGIGHKTVHCPCHILRAPHLTGFFNCSPPNAQLATYV